MTFLYSRRLPSALALWAALAAVAVHCGPEPVGGEKPATSATSALAASASASAIAASSMVTASGSPSSSATIPTASASGAASTAVANKGNTQGCPDGMLRVEGEYCPDVDEKCLEHHKEYERDKAKNVSERCLRFAEPSVCKSKERVHLSFCMDKYEYPNQVGELPLILVSWVDAGKMCSEQGKRLCTEDEFNFACEGPDMLPHVYGFVRDETICNIDKPYKKRTKTLKKYKKCLTDKTCAAELARLDQRHKIGDNTTCVSWAGIVDMNGNVNEWVNLPKEKPPNRSGLKGGWWGPVRNRCRPTVTFHKEEDFGYEAGFRCCKDTSDSTPAPKSSAP